MQNFSTQQDIIIFFIIRGNVKGQHRWNSRHDIIKNRPFCSCNLYQQLVWLAETIQSPNRLWWMGPRSPIFWHGSCKVVSIQKFELLLSRKITTQGGLGLSKYLINHSISERLSFMLNLYRDSLFTPLYTMRRSFGPGNLQRSRALYWVYGSIIPTHVRVAKRNHEKIKYCLFS